MRPGHTNAQAASLQYVIHHTNENQTLNRGSRGAAHRH